MIDKKIVGFLVLIIFIVLIGLISSNFNYEAGQTVKQDLGRTNLPEGCGYNIISLDTVSYKSNDPNLDWDESILLTVVMSEENECAYGYLKAEDINAELEDQGIEKKVQYDFDILIDSLEQTCDYRITPRTSERVYIVDITNERCYYEGLSTCYDDRNTCLWGAEYYDYALFDYGGIPYVNHVGELFCLHRESEGFTGTIGNPNYNFPVKISVRNYNEPSEDSVILDGHEARSRDITDFVYAEWNGYLMSGVSCPSLSGSYVAGYGFSSETWSVKTKKYKEDYDFWHKTETKDCIDDITDKYYVDCNQGPIVSPDKADECSNKILNDMQTKCISPAGPIEVQLQGHNYYANRLLITDTRIIWDWAGPYKQVVSGDEYVGDITLIAGKKKLSYPVITLHVNAEWMGIYSPVGIPKIREIDPDQVDFISNEEGYVDITVENIGEGAEYFDVYLTCSSGITHETRVSTDKLSKNEKDTVRMWISGFCNVNKTGKCTVTAKGKRNEDVKTDAISVECLPQPVCEDGDRRCSPDRTDIEACENGAWNEHMECEYGCIITLTGSPACRMINCSSHSDCSDGDPCTSDRCEIDIFGNSRCVNDLNPNMCLCGNGICEAFVGEDIIECPEDCGYCGNGICESERGENFITCSLDCEYQCAVKGESCTFLECCEELICDPVKTVCVGCSEEGESCESISCCGELACGGDKKCYVPGICDPAKCPPFNIFAPGESLGCWFHESIVCPITEWLKGVFQFVGMIVIIIVILVAVFFIFKTAIKSRIPRFPRIPFYPRGYGY